MFGRCRLDIWTLEAQNIAKKRYMKCTLCLGFVGARHLLELKLPVISGWPWRLQSLVLFCKLSGAFMSIFK